MKILLVLILLIVLPFTLVSPELAWNVFVYLVCTIVVNGILFLVLFINGIGHGGGWTSTADIVHKTTMSLFVVWNLFWTWFVFF
ncbi:hypothetical protein A4_220 [Escherichia phage A4]|nr:hypothetical protein A4_220 [Escherichia phage A4]